MRLLLPQKLHNGFTPRPERVPRVQHVDDHVRRVEDFVELSPDSAGGAFGVDGFGGEVANGVEGGGGFGEVFWLFGCKMANVN